ncbi:MAG TPA: 1-aminocyclopropane-1-carboxylate deaminase/D-cysteine desulfhydrase, partial [Phaeodactylibacter sp.]|nr:1-aminocyclopropane-1-carboxylate deaminase/D-cysteine desulfhydrase [Phaeodactylibacter sp.]
FSQNEKNVQIWVKRDDLTHPEIQGNKWRKLKYNLIEAKKLGKKYLLTFGGAYSNHLYATAAAGKLFGFKTIGIVRGEKVLPLNPTLSFVEGVGMDLHFVDRKTYRLKEKLLPSLDIDLKEVYVLPEGGTNHLAVKGCVELGDEIFNQLNFAPDYICTSCGTGGTVAGIIAAAKPQTQVLGYSALKGDFLKKEVHELLSIFYPNKKYSNYAIQTEYHFGGYAKHSPTLLQFMDDFKQQYHIQLDPIYTGKMFFGIFDLIEKGFFPPHSKIVAIHTGGLQGIAGFQQRFG